MSDRLCRSCGCRYEYPARNALATRSHCETCASLAPNVRKVFEDVRRQLAALRGEVRTLKAKLADRDAAG